MKLIDLDKSKCVLCYACVRVCPTKAIALKVNEEFPQVLHDRCIGCGACATVCSPGAITWLDSRKEAMDLIHGNNKVAAIVDPSISGEFPDITDYRKFVSMIRSLGFDYVNEVSFGVDLIGSQYRELFNNFKGRFHLSGNCPSLVSYIEKFAPELLYNLAPIINPMVATAKVVRKKYGQDLAVVFIGPCVSAKHEATLHDDDGKVDAVLTFKELRQLFAENNIVESTLEYSEFDGPIGYTGSLYPLSNGLVQSAGIDDNLLTGNVITTGGSEKFLESVKTFKTHAELIKRHFDIYFCNGCMMGPGTSPNGKKYIRRTLTTEYANKRLKTFDKAQWDSDIDEYNTINFTCQYKNDDQRIAQPPIEKINEVLKVIGKTPDKAHLGCGACGYESCQEFAIAVSKGLAKPEMCLTFNLKNQADYIKTLKSTNEKLARTETALKDSEQRARREQQSAQEATEIITAMMQKLPSGVVIVDQDLKILEANRTFIDILGEDARMIDEVIPGLVGADLKSLLPFNFYNMFSFVLKNDEDVTNKDTRYNENLLNVSIFTIRKNKIVGAVVRDMYVPEVRKEQIVGRINDAITENLEMVQKIAFLLGEGAAHTERMLNSIVQSYQPVKDTDKRRPEED
ncbi:MAG: histidine kinase [Bacteroidetes bacterium HGW-Bacteroidetes-22]|nr:MAG: histidine kinase [Bacteroidetes bacterium HGW-Bacteroidetes-22]